MSKVLSFDIETKNLSYEIGGWENQHLFKVACITTWDGEKGVVYVDEPVTDSLSKAGVHSAVQIGHVTNFTNSKINLL